MNILLIPSANILSPEMQKKFGVLPSALCPYNNKTILEHIIEKYKSIVDQVYIISYRKPELFKNYINVKNLNIKQIQIDSIKDIGYSISFALSSLAASGYTINQLYITFGDTLTNNVPVAQSDVIYYDRKPVGGDKWTMFSENNGVLIDIIDKNDSQQCSTQLRDIFIGEFAISNVSFFTEVLMAQLAVSGESDSFYQALFTYSKSLPFSFILAKEWVDVGHPLPAFKAKQGAAARSFNTIQLDPNRGILKKKSENKEKFIDEIKWYISLPSNLQYLAPRIYSYSLDPEYPYVSMEYYGYDTLHELFVYGKLPLTVWRGIFEHIHFILEDMRGYVPQLSVAEQIKQHLQDFYVEKTRSRLLTLKDDPLFVNMFKDDIVINGVKYHSLSHYLEILPSLVEDYLLSPEINKICVTHGDLCFTNILVETDYNFMRLIDPRGSFGDESSIFGDSRYDIAKLMHSLEGGYDYIIEDMVKVSVDGNEISFDNPCRSPKLIALFKEVFSDYLVENIAIELIEATLFLSMVPLHRDFKTRQIAMLATGIILLENVLSLKEKEDRLR